MPVLTSIPIATSTGSAYSGKSNDSLLKNLYTTVAGNGSKTPIVIMNTDGILEVSSAEHTIYGIHEFNNDIYVVTAEKLLKLDNTSGTLDYVAAVSFDRTVVMADNGTDIMIVGGNGYAYTPDTLVLKNMEDEEGWYASDTVGYMDGYFIFNRSDTGQFFISKLYSTELDPLDYATGEAYSDNTIGVIVANRTLWLMGAKSLEVWYDAGNPLFPFTRISGGVIDIGVVTHTCIAKVRDSVLFVGNDFKVYATNGYTPQIISTAAIEKVLIEGNVSLMSAFTYSNNGTWFYVLTVNNNQTFVYDLSTQQWHTRSTGEIGKWLIDGALNRHKQNRPVGYAGTKLYTISLDHLTDDGVAIHRQLVSTPINPGVNRFRLNEAQLDMEVALDIDVEVILKLSDDGGRTFSARHSAYLGKVGHHNQRVRWMRLGQHRDCIISISIFDAVPIRILGLFVRTS